MASAIYLLQINFVTRKLNNNCKPLPTPTLEQFTPVTVEEVDKMIGSVPYKTCQLDPVPTWLVK